MSIGILWDKSLSQARAARSGSQADSAHTRVLIGSATLRASPVKRLLSVTGLTIDRAARRAELDGVGTRPSRQANEGILVDEHLFEIGVIHYQAAGATDLPNLHLWIVA